jgi:acylphosphatase
MSAPEARLHAFVSGTVQGVGFRAFVAERAEFIGLTGWVRNTFDGEVEVLAEGRRADLDILYRALLKGPFGSYVSGIRTQWVEPSGEFTSFNIERTA